MEKYDDKKGDIKELAIENLEELEFIENTRNNISYLKEEVSFYKKNPEYKALCDKQNSIKAKVKDFDTFMGLAKEYIKYIEKDSPTAKRMGHAILTEMMNMPTGDHFLDRVDVNYKRNKLYKKLKEQDKSN